MGTPGALLGWSSLDDDVDMTMNLAVLRRREHAPLLGAHRHHAADHDNAVVQVVADGEGRCRLREAGAVVKRTFDDQ
jgi:hypothetical protein